MLPDVLIAIPVYGHIYISYVAYRRPLNLLCANHVEPCFRVLVVSLAGVLRRVDEVGDERPRGNDERCEGPVLDVVGFNVRERFVVRGVAVGSDEETWDLHEQVAEQSEHHHDAVGFDHGHGLDTRRAAPAALRRSELLALLLRVNGLSVHQGHATSQDGHEPWHGQKHDGGTGERPHTDFDRLLNAVEWACGGGAVTYTIACIASKRKGLDKRWKEGILEGT